MARLAGPNGKEVRIAKGATKVILDMCRDKDKVRAQVLRANQDLADRGFRSIGVCRDVGKGYVFAGVLALFDPPRHDTRDTLEKARAMGVRVKMVTGDQTAIARRDVSKAIALAEKPVILDMKEFQKAEAQSEAAAANMCERVDGLRGGLPRAQIPDRGVAPGREAHGGHDGRRRERRAGAQEGPDRHRGRGARTPRAPRADIVLTEPGLGVIIDAILTARCIFARVRNYVIYRIACTLQLVGFFFLASLIFAPEDYYCYMDDERKIVGSYFDSCDYTNPDSGTLSPTPATATRPGGRVLRLPVLLPPGPVRVRAARAGHRDHHDPERRLHAHDRAGPRHPGGDAAGLEPAGAAARGRRLGLRAAGVVAPAAVARPEVRRRPLPVVGLPVQPQGAVGLPERGGRPLLPEVRGAADAHVPEGQLSELLPLFCARCRALFSRAPAVPLFCAFLVATGSATLIAMFGTVSDKTYPMYAISKQACLVVWVYNLAFFLVQDAVKVGCYKHEPACCEASSCRVSARGTTLSRRTRRIGICSRRTRHDGGGHHQVFKCLYMIGHGAADG